MEDKTEKYQAILVDILTPLADWWNNARDNVKHKVLIDKENHHVLMVSAGWRGDIFEHSVPFHFEIWNGKIWVLQNNTDEDLDMEFWKHDISIKDIVIAWHSDFLRQMEGYEYGVA